MYAQPDQQSRFRSQQLPPVSTQFQGQHGPVVGGTTPMSASNLSHPLGRLNNPAYHSTSPSSQPRYQQTAVAQRGPAAAPVPYNPQAWQGDAQSSQFRPAPPPPVVHDPEAGIAAPPPPYSPRRPGPELDPRSSEVQQAQHVQANASAYNPAAVQQQQYAPPIQSVQHTQPVQYYPPPPIAGPNARSRSASRPRDPALPVRGGLSSIGLRTTQQAQQPQPQPQEQIHRQSMVVGSQQNYEQSPPYFQPPSSRRAQSASAIRHQPPSLSGERSPNQWTQGMNAAPPPPPGPPPRAVSQGRAEPDQDMRGGRGRRSMAAHISSLPPVPPTPANWTDETPGVTHDPMPESAVAAPTREKGQEPEYVSSPEGPRLGHTRRESGVLQRSGHARRDSSTKGIRERRQEARGSKIEDMQITTSFKENGEPMPSSSLSSGLPRSSPAMPSPNSLKRSAAVIKKGLNENGESSPRNLTPRSLHKQITSPAAAPTPPFSPEGENQGMKLTDANPRSLPTPPPTQPGSAGKPRGSGLDAGTLSPGRESPRLRHMEMGSLEIFQRAAIDRHNAFIEREANAKTDRDRVKIFAEYIVAESRLRRDRYSDAIDSMGLELLELTRGLFQPYNASRSTVASPVSAGWGDSDANEHRGSISKALMSHFPPTPDGGSASEDESPASATSRDGRPDSAHGQYKPQLSPIPSMSVSEAPDEWNSRGRSLSRWWEGSQDDNNNDRAKALERSKRESRFMGVPREVRESLQKLGASGPGHASGSGAGYNEKEYPPEKGGYSPLPFIPPPPPLPMTASPIQRVHTPDPNKMDVSRLVTLPPPYPRHYPAVNNAHPDLSELRTVFRSLNDMSEISEIKQAYEATSSLLLEQQEAEAAERKTQSRKQISQQIEAGTMTYADAAQADADFQKKELEIQKDIANAQFDRYQSEVVKPLSPLFNDRVIKATSTFERLRSELFSDAQKRSPDMPQEAGDEQPELLEKLTLLKWLFDARENLHKEIHELNNQRTLQYKSKILTLYKLSGKEDKCAEAEGFFAQDARERDIAYKKDAINRLAAFNDIVEENIVRGVEVQLSAFWDIAPGLAGVIEKIPETLKGFQIQIPPEEFADSPSYSQHPLQYLFTLLDHAQKSSYQFIEAQTSLFCLIHETKSLSLRSKWNLTQSERINAGESEDDVKREIAARLATDEKRYTDDLKEKVRTVEGQWADGLGTKLERCKDRVRRQLEAEGGWDEELVE